MACYKKYRTVAEMQETINKYFKECDEKDKPYSITALALALGFNSRQSLINYEGYTDEDDIKFLDTIKTAKARVEANIEEKMLSGKYNATGAIFNLKNNFNWKDKTEVETSGENELNINIKVI